MAFCPQCGAQISDDAAFCPNCGYQESNAGAQQPNYQQPNNYQQPVAPKESGLVTAAKILMVITTVATGWALIPLAWMIPMTVKVFNCAKTGEKLSTGFKVCTLIFANLISGILLLCDDTI